jgi:hypothetical protein
MPSDGVSLRAARPPVLLDPQERVRGSLRSFLLRSLHWRERSLMFMKAEATSQVQADRERLSAARRALEVLHRACSYRSAEGGGISAGPFFGTPPALVMVNSTTSNRLTRSKFTDTEYAGPRSCRTA